MTLAQLQASLARAFRYGQEDEVAAGAVVSSPELSSAERIKIYQGSIRAGLINTLKATYPVVDALVGAKFFSAMCARYIATAPSTSPDLNDYGVDFDTFLATFEPAQTLPYLADVARLEWAWHQLLFATKNTPADIAPLANLSESALAELRFELPTDAILLESPYPVYDIWQYCCAEVADALVEIDSATQQLKPAEPETTNNPDGPTINLDAGGTKLILFRDQSGRHMNDLSEPQYTMLQQAQQKAPFEALAEHHLAQHDQESFEHTFASCITQGWMRLPQ